MRTAETMRGIYDEANNDTTAIFRQCVFRETEDGRAGQRELLVEAEIRVVCVDAKTLRPRRIAEYIP